MTSAARSHSRLNGISRIGGNWQWDILGRPIRYMIVVREDRRVLFREYSAVRVVDISREQVQRADERAEELKA